MRRYKVIVSLQSSKIQTSTTLNDPNSYFGRRAEVGEQHAKIPTPWSTPSTRNDGGERATAARHAVFGYVK